eukprot:2979785-Prymnesium_polylepis.1
MPSQIICICALAVDPSGHCSDTRSTVRPGAVLRLRKARYSSPPVRIQDPGGWWWWVVVGWCLVGGGGGGCGVGGV